MQADDDKYAPQPVNEAASTKAAIPSFQGESCADTDTLEALSTDDVTPAGDPSTMLLSEVAAATSQPEASGRRRRKKRRGGVGRKKATKACPQAVTEPPADEVTSDDHGTGGSTTPATSTPQAPPRDLNWGSAAGSDAGSCRTSSGGSSAGDADLATSSSTDSDTASDRGLQSSSSATSSIMAALRDAALVSGSRAWFVSHRCLSQLRFEHHDSQLPPALTLPNQTRPLVFAAYRGYHIYDMGNHMHVAHLQRLPASCPWLSCS
jgi:hypothetical protein